MQLPSKVEHWNSATAHVAPQFVAGMALIILGLDLHLYNAGEILASVVLSGIAVLLLVLVLLSGFLVWQGVRRMMAMIASWNSQKPSLRPVVLAKLGS